MNPAHVGKFAGSDTWFASLGAHPITKPNLTMLNCVQMLCGLVPIANLPSYSTATDA